MNTAEDIIKKIVWISVFILGLFQIIAYPFMLLQGNFTMLCICYSLLLAIVFFWYISKKKKDFVCILKNQRKVSEITIGKIMFIALVAVQIFSYVILKHSDADDNFFAAIPNLCISSDRVLGYEASMGLEYHQYSANYRMVGYEVFVGYLSKITQINSSTIFHTILPGISIGLYYMIQYLTGKKIFGNNWAKYGILINLLNLFGGYAVYSTGSFLLLRLGQGKAVACNLVFSYMFYLFLCQYREKNISLKSVMQWIIVLFAGISTSAVAIYLVPIFYGIYVAGWIVLHIKTGIKLIFKNFLKMCIPIICILPVVITVLLLLMNVGNVSSLGAGSENIDSIQIAKMVQGNSKIWLMFIISCIVVLILGNKCMRILITIPNILLCATIINPIFAGYAAKYITGVTVYWRVFWLFPVYIVIAMAGTYTAVWLSDRLKKKILGGIVFMLCAFAICRNGTFIYNSNNFSIAENKCKISKEVMEVADTILGDKGEEAVLLADSSIWLEIRQYTGEIKILKSRYSHGKQQYNKEVNILYDKLFIDKNATNEDIEFIAELCGMNYVKIYKENYSLLQKKYEAVYEGKDYYIVKL